MQDINIVICEYIDKEWIKNTSNRAFANEHDIDERTVRQIKKVKETYYSISITTLEKICDARGITLSDFFKLIKR